MSTENNTAPVAAVESSPAVETQPQQTAPAQTDTKPSESVAKVDQETGLDTKAAAEPKHKIKIDGEEVELTESEMKRYASMGKAAQKRMQEAAQIRKEHEKLQSDVQELLGALKGSTANVLRELGIDPMKLAEEIMSQKLEEEAKTPEQKEKEALLKKLEEFEKKAKEQEENERKAKEALEFDKIAREIDMDINTAFEKADIPKDPVFVKRVAALMGVATMQGIDLKASDVIPLAKKQAIEELRGLAGIVSDELLEEIITTDRVKAMRKKVLNNLKKPPEGLESVKSVGSEAVKPEQKEKKYIKSKDFFKKLGSF